MKPEKYRPLPQGYYQRLQKLTREKIWEEGQKSSPAQVRAALVTKNLSTADFMALLSPAGEDFLEETARKAQALTRRQFGRAIGLFTPLYLANYCTNHCLYCGFNSRQNIARHSLTPEEVEGEALAIKATGLRNILALTGDAPGKTGPDYLAACLKALAKHFPSVSVEVPAMTIAQYAQVAAAGATGVTLFQETYNEPLYSTLHLAGPKRDFSFRLEAPERAAQAGIRSLNLGALLGLDDWRRDIFFMAMHAHFLQRGYPEIELSLSLPRLRPCGEAAGSQEEPAFQPGVVSDKNLVQALVALRCFLPQAGITISTRETASLRDKLIPLGVTRVSAGVSTAVGGHNTENNQTEAVPQFIISDGRSVAQMAEAIENLGYQPVYTDWLLTGGGADELSWAVKETLGNIHESMPNA